MKLKIKSIRVDNGKQRYHNRDISPLSPYSKQKIPTTPITRRYHLFSQVQINRSRWIRKFYEGMPVVIMTEYLKGNVVRETAKSCYVQIGTSELKPRLKQNNNVEEDLDS